MLLGQEGDLLPFAIAESVAFAIIWRGDICNIKFMSQTDVPNSCPKLMSQTDVPNCSIIAIPMGSNHSSTLGPNTSLSLFPVTAHVHGRPRVTCFSQNSMVVRPLVISLGGGSGV
eukprot:GHVO01020039.1.p1 GENE.GHVO01020039.1~~GHVO01020039.1.p1  ORF type:complete len:115 (+),score=26.25 GHVO01020039.1:348-692(+)